MAVSLRLTRMGRKKRPFYRIIAIDSRKRRDGKYIERIGYYDPITNPIQLEVDHDLAIKWLQRGAQPSQTVTSLFRKAGVMLRWDMVKRGYDQADIEAAVSENLRRKAEKLVQTKVEEAKATVVEEKKVENEPKAVKEPAAKKPEAKQPETKELEAKELEAKELEAKEPETKESEVKEPEAKAAEEVPGEKEEAGEKKPEK